MAKPDKLMLTAQQKNEQWRKLIGKYGIGIILLLMIVLISILEPSFLNLANLKSVTMQVSINAMISYGMCVVMTTGGIDLSVGALIALVSCLLGQLIENVGLSIPVAIFVALIVSAAWGLINGFLVSKFHMFPFVATLSTQLVIRGLGQVLSGGRAVSIRDPHFQKIYSSSILGVPFPILVFLVIGVLMYILIHWTKFGRYVVAVGDNEKAAMASGVKINKIKISAYVLSAVLAGIAGVILTAKTSSAQANIGVGYETDAIAASVLGGTSFNGGITTIPGVTLGIFIIGLIYNGMNLIGIDSYYQSITKGLIIIAAVMIDLTLNKREK